MSPSAHVVPIVDSTSVFKPDIFKGKVLFCTGGGSGICRGMTEAMVSSSISVLGEYLRNSIYSPRCVMGRMPPSWAASMFAVTAGPLFACWYSRNSRLDRLTQAAKELSEATGQECIPTQADVRYPAQLKDAAAKTIAKFGRIDYVICGMYMIWS